MIVVTISNSKGAVEMSALEIQTELIKLGFVNISKAVFVTPYGQTWTVRVIPAVIEALGWTLEIDLNAMLEAQGHVL